tara:strand:- start:2258 stop:2545 length:288 start_codon:yes stop_codon:yes gene_type:complete
MNILEDFEQIVLSINLLINDIWKLVLFETSFQESSILVVVWALVVYFVVIFISTYVLKIIIEGVFKFLFNPITIIFIIFIIGLSIWTIIQISNGI